MCAPVPLCYNRNDGVTDHAGLVRPVRRPSHHYHPINRLEEPVKLEHVAFNVPEPAAMAAWYVEHLGLKLVLAAEQAPYMHFLSDDAGSLIELYNNPKGPIFDYEEVNPYSLHLAFSTSDMDGDIARLVAAGARQWAEIELTPRGDRLVFLRDPWEVTVQLVQRSSPLA